MRPTERLTLLRRAWESGEISFDRLVLKLEALIESTRDDLSEPEFRAAFHAWGQLEIINALALDAGRPLSNEDLRDAGAELDRLFEALSTVSKDELT